MDAVQQALFQGADIPPEARAAIAKNFESMLARSTLAAAAMAMDADVVLVAAAADGVTEEKVRASSSVLARTSSGFRGVLEESPGEIKLWRPGAARVLHPIAAVRFVMAVVHAVEAHEETPTAGLDVGAPPPLDVLLSACQIADCWDCPPVLAAVARCVQSAAAAERDKKRVASVLVKMLKLVQPLDERSAATLTPLRPAAEKAIATCVPIDWLPLVLKSFSLESACRVINEIDDLEVELTPLVLKGASMLEKAWYDPSREDYQTLVESDPTAWVEGSLGGRKKGERRLNGSFRINVYAQDPDESTVQSKREVIERLTDLAEQHPTSALDQPLADAKEQLRIAQMRGLRCNVHVDGTTVVLGPGSHVRIQPDDDAREPITRYFVCKDEVPEAFCSSGWDRVAAVEELGGFRAGGTIVISKLWRQWQVLEGWQRLTGARRAPGPCPIVASLERLLAASRCVETRVRMRVSLLHGGTGLLCDGTWGPIPARLSVEAERPDEPPRGATAAAKLAASLTQLVICRLDDSNGPVNRATARLDLSTMLQILEQRSFPGIIAPKSEKALLRIAVDWSSQPGRSKEAIEAVMSKIHFAGVPTRTLMHLDEGSSFSSMSGLPTSHKLSESLFELAHHVPKVCELMTEALEAQRTGKHIEAGSELLRPCFKNAPPPFPKGEDLLSIGSSAHDYISNLQTRAERAEKELEEANAALAQTKAELESERDKAYSFRAAVLHQRARKRTQVLAATAPSKRQKQL